MLYEILLYQKFGELKQYNTNIHITSNNIVYLSRQKRVSNKSHRNHDDDDDANATTTHKNNKDNDNNDNNDNNVDKHVTNRTAIRNSTKKYHRTPSILHCCMR